MVEFCGFYCFAQTPDTIAKLKNRRIKAEREFKGFARSVSISNSTPGLATKPGQDSMKGIIFKPLGPDTYFTGIYSQPTR